MAVKHTSRKIFVYAHWSDLSQPHLMGMLSSTVVRGKEIFSFEYDKDWLRSKYALQIDPDLSLYQGVQFVHDDKKNFGVFLDSSPDRWGRLLMKRREAALARHEERKENILMESDFLLGVFDGSRMGAIRFKEDINGNFLNDNAAMAAPPWTFLRELQQISLELEREDVVDDPAYLKWLNILIAPGSSLGGSRPKASVVDHKNALWIAKFPSRNDEYDVGGWEMVVNELAVKAGITAAGGQAQKFANKHHTFLTKRFDRTANNSRIHFASAMTLLGYNDGTDFHDGVSYLELVDFILQHGAQPDKDLEELWRRIVFYICVKNTDDHLRNHGFILTSSGWRLSPAYDINPTPYGSGLRLNISQSDNSLDLGLAMEVFDFFNLKEENAIKIVRQVVDAVNNWKTVAEKFKLSRNEQALMANAFTITKSYTPVSKREILCDALKSKRRVKFFYHGKERTGEPQCCGISKTGKEVIRMHLVKGGSRPEQLFEISEMKSLQVLNQHFDKPGPNYRKNDSHMREIFCQL